MPNVEDYRSLNGHQKAAIMMLALGEEQAMKLFALMDEGEIKELSQTMAQLGAVNSAVVERLFSEFADQIAATGSLTGSFESTERLLMKTMPASTRLATRRPRASSRVHTEPPRP